MTRLWLACAVLMLAVAQAAPASANRWQATLSDDGAYVAGSVRYPGLGMSFTCHARSAARGSVIDSIWFESTIAEPNFFLITFGPSLVPMGSFERRDLVLFVGQTGYQLPLVQWNEMVGDWEMMLPANDQLFAALTQANRLVLQVGPQSWEIPATGVGEAMRSAYQHCAAGWAAIGAAVNAPAATAPATPQPQPGAFTLPPQIIADVQSKCAGATIDPQALTAGDLDGDGQPDVAVDYSGVTCPGHTINPYCGAANCSIDVFMSSRGYINPIGLLGIGATMVPLANGRMGLGVSGTWSLCGDNGCDQPFVWNGVDLVR